MEEHARRARRGLVIAAVVLASAACGRRPADPTGVTVIVDSGPNSLDPRLGSDEASRRVFDLVFNSLFRTADDGGVVPDLAESAGAPDDRTLVVRLRDGVRFHDGATLTSEDVARTYRSILDGEVVSFRRADFEAVETVESADPRTVIFRLRRPFAPLLSNLTVPILRAGATSTPARAPSGTGPFRLVRYRKDEDLLLARFDDYFEGKSALTSVRIRILPAESARLLEMLRGSGDLVINDLAPEHFDRLARTKGFEVTAHDGRNVVYLGFNLTHPPLDDARVRRAVALAIDRDAIVRHLLSGRARLATALLPPGHWAHDDGVPEHHADPAEARRLLDEAGFADPDGDGPQPRLRLRYSAPQGEQAAQQAAVVQEELAQVGIALDVFTYEWPTFYDDLRSGRFEIVTSNWTDIGDPDIYRLRFHSAFRPPAGLNRGGYVSAEADRLIEIGAERMDRGERRDAYGALQRLLDRDLPCVWLWHRQVRAASGPRLRGFDLAAGADFRPLWRARIAASGEAAAEHRLDREGGDRPGADEARRVGAEIHDGRGGSATGATGVQDRRDGGPEMRVDLGGGGGGRRAGSVGAGGDERPAAGARQPQRDRMRGDAHADRLSAGEQARRQAVRRGQDERQGAGPEDVHQRGGPLGKTGDDPRDLVTIADDHRQRHPLRASLRGEYAVHRGGIRGVGAQRVEGLRGERDETGAAQEIRRRGQAFRLRPLGIDRLDSRGHGWHRPPGGAPGDYSATGPGRVTSQARGAVAA
jgi:peptide/nickel transport system substrate-binding protein